MGLLIFFTLFTISGTFLAAFQCNPPKYTYDIVFLMSPDRANFCFPAMTSYAIFMYQAVLIFCCDIIMFLLPFPALMSVQLNSRKSLALLAVFGSGVVACIAPAIRFKSLNFYKTGSTDTTCMFAPYVLQISRDPANQIPSQLRVHLLCTGWPLSITWV